jgi:mycoredoxin
MSLISKFFIREVCNVSEQNTKIVVYGTQWCGDTIRARRILDNNHIVYQWIDIDQDREAAALVQKMNNGFRSVPTIIFPDGSTLTEPSSDTLMKKLGLA